MTTSTARSRWRPCNNLDETLDHVAPVGPRQVHAAATAVIDSFRLSLLAWLLNQTHLRQRDIAAAFGVRRSTISDRVRRAQHEINWRATEMSRHWNEPWAHRLRAAGAIR